MPVPRATIVPPAIHGARDYEELQRLGLNPDDIIDFSTNSNPYGPHPAVLQAITQAAANPAIARRYPDRDCLALRAAIAAVDDMPPDNILPGNGATELIHLIALAFVKPGSRHLILSPTFGEYTRAIQLMGGNIYEQRPSTTHHLRLEANEVTAAIRRLQPDGVWLCNPNNPTGQYWSAAELAQFRSAAPAHKTLWVFDEAYRHFVKNEKAGPADNLGCAEEPNVIRLRSLTKDYSLAGLRLGYAVAAPSLIQILQAVQLPWSVNSLAQVAGRAALHSEVITWRKQSLARLHQNAAKLWANLAGIGFFVHPTTTTFALIAVDHAPGYRNKLLARGLLVRDCTSFGLPGYIRLAAHRAAANQKLVEAMGNFDRASSSRKDPSG